MTSDYIKEQLQFIYTIIPNDRDATEFKRVQNSIIEILDKLREFSDLVYEANELLLTEFSSIEDFEKKRDLFLQKQGL